MTQSSCPEKLPDSNLSKERHNSQWNLKRKNIVCGWQYVTCCYEELNSGAVWRKKAASAWLCSLSGEPPTPYIPQWSKSVRSAATVWWTPHVTPLLLRAPIRTYTHCKTLKTRCSFSSVLSFVNGCFWL